MGGVTWQRGQLQIHLVRHGQSQWNAAGLIQGQTDRVPLTELGRRQAVAVGRHLAGEQVDLLLTSDLLRALQTADAVSDATGRLPRCDRRLREQCYGVLEGRPASEAAESLAGRTEPTARIGGGESVQDVYDRVGSLLRTCIESSCEEQLSGVVLVSHGDTICVALAWLASLGAHRAAGPVPANGSITTVTLVDGVLAGRHTVVPAPHDGYLSTVARRPRSGGGSG